MKKGFTLVELSIVMVVIGLIIGMSLKGKSLLDSATIRNEVNKLSLMQSAVATLLTTSSSDGSLNELPKDDLTRPYDFIENSFLINKGLLSAKDLKYNNDNHSINYCAYPNSGGIGGNDGYYVNDSTDKSDNMLCAFTPATWPLKFHCVAEVTLDNQNIATGKGRSNSPATESEVRGHNITTDPYDCNKSAKKNAGYSYLLLTSRLVK
jgi:prepilin-type N-terminal cleavage/methylation domain-containing protein